MVSSENRMHIVSLFANDEFMWHGFVRCVFKWTASLLKTVSCGRMKKYVLEQILIYPHVHCSHIWYSALEDFLSSLFSVELMVDCESQYVLLRRCLCSCVNPPWEWDDYLQSSECVWHENNWDNDESRFLAFSLHGASSMLPMYLSSMHEKVSKVWQLPGTLQEFSTTDLIQIRKIAIFWLSDHFIRSYVIFL